MDKNIYIDTLYVDVALVAEPEKQRFIIEAKTSQIGKTKYWYRIDKPFGEPKPGNQEHMHGFILKKNNFKDIFAVNKDGSAHDGWHKIQIPIDYNPILKANGFNIPNNNLIEMVVKPARNSKLILESINVKEEVVLNKDEIEKITLNAAHVFHDALRLVLGITNKPLIEISEERIAEGFGNFRIIKLVPNHETAKLLAKICIKVAKEIRQKDINYISDISNEYTSTACILYVAYE